MSGINNQSGGCRPASAQIQQEQLEIERQMLWQLKAISAPESPLKAKLEFSYSDVHERQIYPPKGTELFTRVILVVTEAFDDTESTLSVGTDANPQGLFPVEASDLRMGCAFETHPNIQTTNSASIKLYLSPAGATQGRGIIYLYAD
jgi:hypothetical protein